MKIVLAQQNYEIGNFTNNLSKITKAISEARQMNADLVVFPEMSLCGSFPFDLLRNESFKCASQIALNEIVAESYQIAVVIGCPIYSGDAIYNSAVVIENGSLLYHQGKKTLSKLEAQYFTPDTGKNVLELKHKRIAICIGNDVPDSKNISLAINICAHEYRCGAESQELSYQGCGFPVISLSQCGANTEAIYEGHSFVSSVVGKRILQLPYFDESLVVYETDKAYPSIAEEQPHHIALLHDALVLGIRDYFRKNKFTNAVLGLSGGIDSAVVLSLAVEALGSDNVRVLLLPSEFSSSHSITDAEALARNLSIEHSIISIKGVYDASLDALAPLFKSLPFSTAEENLQARIRGVLLMAVSNKFGDIVLNTSNKSEVAVGYGTLYGDTTGSLSVLGDVYKTDVFKLARYINRESEVIPIHIITKAPSAELHHGQKDSDSIPEYDVLDKILFHYIEGGKTVEELCDMGFLQEKVMQVVSLIKKNEYKRHQACPVLRVSSKAFSDMKIPLLAVY